MNDRNGAHRPEIETSRTIAGPHASALLLSIGEVIDSHLSVLDRDGNIRGVNRSWRDFARHSWLPVPDQPDGGNYLDICDAVRGKHAADARAIAAGVRDVLGGRSRRLRLEYACDGLDEEQCFELCVAAIEPADGGDLTVLVAHRDITDSRNAKRKLEESLGQVRRLAAHLQDVREQERRVIAREIHDELGHQLTALKIDVVSLERELQRVSSSLAGRAASMKTLLDQVIGSVRRLSSELRPGILDDFGLVAAIEWQVEAFEEHTGIVAELVLMADDAGLGTPLQTAVFRILQESLTNVARHSRATRVQVLLRRDPTELRLEVRDDGAGFEPSTVRDPMSCGLTGMRERVLALGGSFRIDGLPGYGTTVSATLPIEPPAAAQPLPHIPVLREVAAAAS